MIRLPPWKERCSDHSKTFWKKCCKKWKKVLTKGSPGGIIVKLSGAGAQGGKPENRIGTAWNGFRERKVPDKVQKISKKFLTNEQTWDIIYRLSHRSAAAQDLENWTKLKLVEPYRGWKPTQINSITSNSNRTQAIVSEWFTRLNTYKVI